MEQSSQNPTPTAPPNANKISIVTKSEIRYEGILYHINPQDQNITLCNVKSFGTEGRRPGDEIGPSPQVHEYIIFRGTDIKDLKVLEQQQTQPETQPTKKPEQSVEQTPAPREQNREAVQPEKSMKRGENQEDFDFQAMKQKFKDFASEHKPDLNVKTYSQNDFFDNLSTSTADKAREQPFDRIAQKKTDKETFGSEYVDTVTSRGRGGYRRGGGRGGRGGYNRGGYHGGQNRNYGGQRNYEGQNRNYDGQNRNYEGQTRNYEGQNRNYEGQNRNYEGQQKNYEGGQHRNYGQNRNYEGGQQRNYGQNRGYNQNRQYDNQGGYNQGGHNQGGYNQGGYNQGGYNQRRYGDQQSGPRYYKNYQESGHNQEQGDNREGENKNL